jgi:hypothetical protein
MGHIPVGMEMFNAADEEQWAVITRTIDQCDYYIVIVAHRYGSTTPEGISFTEKEYDYAVAQGVPVLGFMINDSARWPGDLVDKNEVTAEALQHFKSKMKQKMVRFWSEKSELQAHFAISLGTSITINPRRGWIRAPESSDVDVAQALSKLAEENARLRKEIEILRLEPSNDDLHDFTEYLRTLLISTISKEGAVSYHLTGVTAFQEIAQAAGGRPVGLEKIARTMDANRDGSEVDRKDLESLLKELALCGIVSNMTTPGHGMRWQVTQLGQRMYVRLAKEATAAIAANQRSLTI